MIDQYRPIRYDWKTPMNSMLKAPRSDKNLDIVIIGYLKKDSSILHWIISHILCPKKGGYYRISHTEVHLIYILQKKVRINWPHTLCLKCLLLRIVKKGNPFVIAH